MLEYGAVMKPKLRPVETFPINSDGEELIGLRDTSGIGESVLLVSPSVFFLLQFFDGNHTFLDIQEACQRRIGSLVMTEDLHKVVSKLDEALLLDSDRFQSHQRRLLAEYRGEPRRRAAHSGGSYTSDPVGLVLELEGFYQKGAGLPSVKNHASSRQLLGLIAPHIDLRVGGACYTHAYRALAERGGADIYIVLGTSHLPMSHPFCTTAKDFATPLGVLPSASEFLERLSMRYSAGSLFEDELKHRADHTIEFQAIFLQHLSMIARLPSPRLVPILCAFSNPNDPASAAAEAKPFVEALAETIREFPDRSVCLIASADLAHLGPRYGDPDPPSEEEIRRVEQEEKVLLDLVSAVAPDAFLEKLFSDSNRRRVCGYSCIYTLLAVLREFSKSGESESPIVGRLLKYDWGVSDPSGSVVTYAGMLFERAPGSDRA